METAVHSLAPIISQESRILILGTLPGEKSISIDQYYADPRNQFWRIIYNVYDEIDIDNQYEHRVEFLLKRELAIWDILKIANRQGSLDKNIQNELLNDIPKLLKQYPNIQCIILAGKKATKLFEKYYPNIGVKTVSLPSTSATPGKYVKPIDEKIQLWKNAILES